MTNLPDEELEKTLTAMQIEDLAKDFLKEGMTFEDFKKYIKESLDGEKCSYNFPNIENGNTHSDVSLANELIKEIRECKGEKHFNKHLEFLIKTGLKLYKKYYDNLPDEF